MNEIVSKKGGEPRHGRGNAAQPVPEGTELPVREQLSRDHHNHEDGDDRLHSDAGFADDYYETYIHYRLAIEILLSAIVAGIILSILLVWVINA